MLHWHASILSHASRRFRLIRGYLALGGEPHQFSLGIDGFQVEKSPVQLEAVLFNRKRPEHSHDLLDRTSKGQEYPYALRCSKAIS